RALFVYQNWLTMHGVFKSVRSFGAKTFQQPISLIINSIPNTHEINSLPLKGGRNNAVISFYSKA
ncbi:hypothetical protein EA007_27645, partial [Vibrio anguillarum]|nr:hypothetical protein [Vibrio anguillarum]